MGRRAAPHAGAGIGDDSVVVEWYGKSSSQGMHSRRAPDGSAGRAAASMRATVQSGAAAGSCWYSLHFLSSQDLA